MALSDIAEGLEVTTEQRNRGVATVDDTGRNLRERLETFADDLPCAADTAETILETHASGTSVGESARQSGVAPITAAKTLHLLGVHGVSPLPPMGHEIIRDWLSADLSRSEARALTGANETEFALATFIETHEPIAGAAEVVEGALTFGGDAAVRKRDALAETMSGVGDLF
ncbi:hypothetical protein SAMN05421858_2893 [Haladaptatus litoreus]|uniref:Uncharacterized protein n=1 Tax=Haladaptatus litoreus TaxID=553468 RepID=A0A1N7C1M1_9EURY|nr:hypothetical protein [Haladaptatus litoreus]SIR57354.1 hypothetical protein SAMN05421858_2893 [Haladaptatus litoreus]